MSKWDARFLDLAEHVAGWSKDPSTKVGAVVAEGKRFVSLGYNGFPSGVEDYETRLADRELKLKMTVHAEPNAILSAGRRLEGCTIYVTRPPCAGCAALIIQSGLSRAVWRTPPDDFVQRWREDLELTYEMLWEARVKMDII